MRRKQLKLLKKYSGMFLCTSLLFTSVGGYIPTATFAAETVSSTTEITTQESKTTTTSNEVTTTPTEQISLTDSPESESTSTGEQAEQPAAQTEEPTETTTPSESDVPIAEQQDSTTETQKPEEKTSTTESTTQDQLAEEIQQESQQELLQEPQQEPLIDYNLLPELLITEIMADNVGADEYEFFEVYNNSNQPLVLDYYDFAIRYTDGSGKADVPLEFESAVIQPKETVVMWLNLKNKPLSDFNSHYQIHSSASQVISSTNAIGLYNSGNRSIVIKKPDGSDLSRANYTIADIGSGQTIQYTYPSSGIDMVVQAQKAVPTPTQVTAGQVPVQEVVLPENQAPEINHTPIHTITTDQDLVLSATVQNDDPTTNVTLTYEVNGSKKNVPMTKKEGTMYQTVIPKQELVGTELHYYISASDQFHQVTYPMDATQPITVEIQEKAEEDYQSYSPIMITEISPNSKGAGTDYFEFIEIYNNSNQPLPLANYRFIYQYTDGSRADLPFQIPAVTVESQNSIVLWFNNGGKTLDDFNANFGTSLARESVVEFTDVFPGFANGGNRAITIRDQEGKDLVTASYLGSENDNNGNDIAYKYPLTGSLMEKFATLAAPTPGQIQSGQVPAQAVQLPEIPKDTSAPTIQHKSIQTADELTPISIQAEIVDDLAIPTATLFYKNETMGNYTSISMIKNSESSMYSADIPSTDVTSSITYYLEATDGINTIITEEYLVAIEKTQVDYTKLPSLLVTEVLPDSTNVGSADGYEFIEVYNNSTSSVSLKDYKLNYRYYMNDPSSDVVWASVPDDVVIPARETLVFWIINEQNGAKTVADFNQQFGTNLVENEDIVRIFSSGMANGSLRGLVMATNTGKEIAVAYYNDQSNVDDTLTDKGIHYKFPTDKSTKMQKLTIDSATPGSVSPTQVPVTARTLPTDSDNPKIENLTDVAIVNQKENIEVVAKASDDKEVKTVKIYYKISGQAQFNEAIVKENYDDNFFHHMIYSPELIGKKYVDYYLFASDGTNDVTSETYRVQITNDLDQSSLRVNVKDRDILAKNKVIKATSATDEPEKVKLSIDGTEVTTDLYSSLEHTAYLAFEANGLNTYFQNAVTMGEDILYLMDKDWLSAWKTFSVPITSERLQMGDNTITIRSGNKASPFDLGTAENRDDYDLRNVRLVLADGTVLTDPAYNNPSRVLKMNDANPFVDFHFTITEEHAKSKSYLWNTTTVTDGEHTITVADSDEKISTNVLVDNTAPTILTNIEEGKTYKGAFTIEANAKDSVAGVEKVKALLDDEEIKLPFETASSKLLPGEHKLSLKAVDAVGNEANLIVHFSVVNENPSELVDESSFGQTPVDGDPILKVKVTDPTDDKMDVSFYEGFQYDPGEKEHVKGYTNVADVEPPNDQAPQGEETFSEDSASLVSKQDGSYLTTDSSEGFPYHRFDVRVDEKVDANDQVELYWSGNSLPGRKVSMYAWSHTTNKWELIDYKIAGEEDFTLKGNVEVEEFVHDRKINVLVQDEIPATPHEYDYTFVWMSDTQYYSESYPYIYEKQTKWIADHQEDMKIKYVFHTGDLVNISTDMTQWSRANEYMKVLDDNNVPYGVLAGNHDVDQVSTDYTNYYKYFGEERFKNKPYYGGSYLNNRGHYDLISVGGNDYIMVYLGWGVTDEGIKWMNEVLQAHSDRKAILNFHEYLLATGTRHPLGEKLFNEVVKPNKNVMAVLSGHYHEAQTLIDEIDDNGDGTSDRKVYQMLADYQAGPEGGQGYMRLLHFDVDNNRVLVNTYSPYLNDYNFYDTDTYGNKDEFVMDLDLAAADKRVATDYFSVNIYTDTLIGEEHDVESGKIAETVWKGLLENQTYSWYAVAADGFTGKTISPIWTFVKGKTDSNDGEVPGDPGSGNEQPHPGPGSGKEQPHPGPGSGNEQPHPGSGSGNEQPHPGSGSGNEQPGTDPGNNQGGGTPPSNSNGQSPNNGGEPSTQTSGSGANVTEGASSGSSIGNHLPRTATGIYNLLLFGIAILALGISGFVLYRKRYN